MTSKTQKDDKKSTEYLRLIGLRVYKPIDRKSVV